MNVHVLAGDSLAEDFRKTNIKGEIIVCRECLVQGTVKAANLEEFWKTRAEFIKSVYDETEEKYYQEVVAEFEKLQNLPPNAEINLWFEYELFCQANMWFCLFLLHKIQAKVFRVMPVVRTEKNLWKGFGGLNSEELEKCFRERIKFSDIDLLLGVNLWESYKNSDYEKLERLSETDSKCFPYLRQVCRAEIEKEFRPKQVLKEVTGNGLSDFAEIFTEFSKREGVYGFGDAQVKRLLLEI